MVARTVDIAGIDHVGIGTDYSHHSSQAYLDWMRMGRWSRVVNYGAGAVTSSGPAAKPQWFTRLWCKHWKSS
jgi:membrane dipeptidase